MYIRNNPQITLNTIRIRDNAIAIMNVDVAIFLFFKIPINRDNEPRDEVHQYARAGIVKCYKFIAHVVLVLLPAARAVPRLR